MIKCNNKTNQMNAKIIRFTIMSELIIHQQHLRMCLHWLHLFWCQYRDVYRRPSISAYVDIVSA